MSRIGLLLPAGRNRQLIAEALAHHNFDSEAVSATEFAAAPVDVMLAEPRLLLDALTMVGRSDPEKQPFDVETGHRPPTLLLTRVADHPLPAPVTEAADEIVTVPVPQRELLDRITRLASRHRQTRDERRLMSEHIAHISHELRTPLQSVLAYADLLHENGLQTEQGQLLDRIIRGGERLLDLVNELLDKSRAEAGHIPDHATVVDLTDTVRDALQTIRPLAEQRHLTVDFREPVDATPFVHADPVYLHRILINLLSNAVKYNREHGAVTVGVRIEAVSIHVDVTDTGPGIPADDIESIFEPYHRLPGSTALGSGLGLPYARMLARGMQGAITASSCPGAGSIFTLTLPRVLG